jgi:hypothetical protein
MGRNQGKVREMSRGSIEQSADETDERRLSWQKSPKRISNAYLELAIRAFRQQGHQIDHAYSSMALTQTAPTMARGGKTNASRKARSGILEADRNSR